jgi:hypothetical protein
VTHTLDINENYCTICKSLVASNISQQDLFLRLCSTCQVRTRGQSLFQKKTSVRYTMSLISLYLRAPNPVGALMYPIGPPGDLPLWPAGSMWLGRPHKTDLVRRSPLKPHGDGNVLEGVGRGTHVWYRASADQWVPATLLSDPGPTCKIALGLGDHNLQGQVWAPIWFFQVLKAAMRQRHCSDS